MPKRTDTFDEFSKISENRFTAAIIKMAANAFHGEILDGPIYRYFYIYML